MTKKRVRWVFFFLLKVLIVASLLYYLSTSEKLHLSSFQLLISDGQILFGSLAFWLLGSVILTSVRWQRLVEGMHLKLSLLKAIRFNLIGFFFNIVSPGAVGGDLIKALYVYRGQPQGRKTPALLSILLDRVMGLYGIFAIASAVALYTRSFQHPVPFIRTSSIFSLSVFLAMTLFFSSVFIPFKEGNDPFLRFFSKPIIGFSTLTKIYLALRSLKSCNLFQAWALAVVYQLLAIAFFLFITHKLSSTVFSIQDFIMVYPVGTLSVALPIAPGGLGVGHLAFERIFYFIGVKEGANIFNIYFIGQSSLNLLGFIPYLFLHETKSLAEMQKDLTED